MEGTTHIPILSNQMPSSNTKCLTMSSFWYSPHSSTSQCVLFKLLVNSGLVAFGMTDGLISIRNIYLVNEVSHCESRFSLLPSTNSTMPDPQVSALAFSSGVLVSGHAMGEIQWWAHNDHELSHGSTIHAHSGMVLCLCLSKDATILVSGSSDCTAKVYHLTRDHSPSCLASLDQHTGPVYAVGWTELPASIPVKGAERRKAVITTGSDDATAKVPFS